MHILYQGKGQ
jgi:hypothetical protein